MTKTVFYILDYYLPHRGGVETVFEQIITRTLAKGRKAIILTSHYDLTLPVKEQEGNLTIIRTGNSRKSFIRKAFWEGKKILSQNSISFIHTSTYGGAIPASLLGWLMDKKVLITVHEVFGKLRNRYKPRWSAWIFRIFERLIFALPYTRYHCVSLYTLNSLRVCYGIADHKLHLVHNGVDSSFRNPDLVSQKEKSDIRAQFALNGYWNLLYYGHTGISKGIDTLVAALPKLLMRFEDLQMIFNIIPAQRQEEVLSRIREQLARLPVSAQERVHIHYWLEKEKLRALVSQVDAVIAPSLSEGFGSVHTETLAMGTGLITTAVASLPEVVGGRAVFFAPESIEGLIDAVHQMKNWSFDPLTEKKFEWTVQFEQIWMLYQKMIGKEITKKRFLTS